jgi:hypothetical protein
LRVHEADVRQPSGSGYLFEPGALLAASNKCDEDGGVTFQECRGLEQGIQIVGLSVRTRVRRNESVSPPEALPCLFNGRGALKYIHVDTIRNENDPVAGYADVEKVVPEAWGVDNDRARATAQEPFQGPRRLYEGGVLQHS